MLLIKTCLLKLEPYPPLVHPMDQLVLPVAPGYSTLAPPIKQKLNLKCCFEVRLLIKQFQ